MCFRTILIATICLLHTCLLSAQIKNDSVKSSWAAPILSDKKNNKFLGRATLLPYLLGNDGGVAASIGFEDVFLKHHSIGIDFFIHHESGNHDQVTDTSGVYYEEGSHHYLIEKAIFINYRYYFNFKKSGENKGISFYISPYYRYGTYDHFNDPSFKVEYVSKKERSHAEGLLLGTIWNIKGFKRGYIDVNAGLFKKQKEITTVFLKNSIQSTSFEKRETLGTRVGVFFVMMLY